MVHISKLRGPKAHVCSDCFSLQVLGGFQSSLGEDPIRLRYDTCINGYAVNDVSTVEVHYSWTY